MKTIIIVIFMIALQSCHTFAAPKTYFQENNLISHKSYDDAWGKIIQWCAVHQFPIKCLDKSSGLLNVEFNLYDISLDKYTDYLLDSGDANISACNVNLYLIIKTSETGTAIKIISHFEGTKVKRKIFGKQIYTNTETLSCKSTGKLENDIIEFINK